MRYLRTLILLPAVTLNSVSLGDEVNSGWSLGVSCQPSGTTSSGSFTFSNASITGSAGTCSRTSNLFTEFTLGSYSGSGTPVTTTLFGIQTGDVLIVPPILTTDVQPIFTVANATPQTGTYTANWIKVQWESSTATLTDTYLIGQATVNPSTSAGGNGVVLTGQWDIDGTSYWSGSVNMPGTWGTGGSAGTYTASGGGWELEGTAFFTAMGAGVFKTTPGSATFFFPQQTITLATLGGITYSGIMFDANQSGDGDVSEVRVVSNTAGTSFTVTPYSNVATNTLASTYTDTIAITNTNSPAQGFLIGTVTRSGSETGTGNLACIASTFNDNRLICSGQSPNNNSIPYNISFAYTSGVSNLYVADTMDNVIRKVNMSSGIITTVVGNHTGGSSGDGGAATSAELYKPYMIALDSVGNLYIADTGNDTIREVSASSGIITRIAGTVGSAAYSGDGSQATLAKLSSPYGVAVDTSGNVFIADTGNNVIRKVTSSSGVISTVAGTGTASYTGDGGQATVATLSNPYGVTVDGSGNIYIADTGNQAVRKVSASTGVISTIAGGYSGYGYSGDGGQATLAQISNVYGVTLDGSGNLYLSDAGDYAVRKVATNGIITTVAGGHGYGYTGDGGQATAAEVGGVWNVAVDSSGNLYCPTGSTDTVRLVTASTGIITTMIGVNGTATYSGDGGQATLARLNWTFGVALGP